jgi:hypothetical protein
VIVSLCVVTFLFFITWSQVESGDASDEIEYEKQYYSDGEHKFIEFIEIFY